MIIKAFGLELTPEQWTQKSFCRVSADEIVRRIEIGWTVQDAITTAPPRKLIKRFKGVSFHKGNNKWIAQIKIDGKVKYLGEWDDDLTAARAYDTAARPLGRETNFNA